MMESKPATKRRYAAFILWTNKTQTEAEFFFNKIQYLLLFVFFDSFFHYHMLNFEVLMVGF